MGPYSSQNLDYPKNKHVDLKKTEKWSTSNI
jgi:hypothetical protein